LLTPSWFDVRLSAFGFRLSAFGFPYSALGARHNGFVTINRKIGHAGQIDHLPPILADHPI